MGIKLTKDEMQLVKEGKLDPNKIEEYRGKNPVKVVSGTDIEKVKQEIRETTVMYKQSIQKNKDLYEELVENRKLKEQYRNQLSDLRKKKKKLLGIE